MTVFAAVPMLALLLSAIVFGVETIFPGRNKRVRIRLLNRLSCLAISHRLIISAQELFNHTLIGCNGVERKLIIVHCLPSGRLQDYIVDLQDVAGISFNKQMKHIQGIPLLQRIMLEINLHSQSMPLEITLFDRKHETNGHAADIAKTAYTWESLLLKILEDHMPVAAHG